LEKAAAQRANYELDKFQAKENPAKAGCSNQPSEEVWYQDSEAFRSISLT
jgi:hypothetical protein